MESGGGCLSLPSATLHIGLHRSHERPREGSTETNVVRGGPLQLLSWVETQLGLNGPEVSWTDRVVAYHRRLAEARGASYQKSFGNDAWATASHLLKRRDGLLLAGWDPADPTGHTLVDDLAVLEPFGGPPGVPDRVLLVLEGLEQGLRLPDHAVGLDEPVDSWPPLWRRLLARLHVQVADPEEARGSGALGAVQSNLLTCRAGPVEGDASLVALRAMSRHSAVQFVAKWMADRDVTVFCPDPETATLLDAALHADGQPTMGVPRESRGQPAHQLLPLVVQLLWKPVNPYVLLDFLLLPVGPLRGLAHPLTRALERQPGYGSDAWNAAVAALLAEDEDGSKAEKLSMWLDHERIPLGEELPTALVEARCGLVAKWATGRAQWEQRREEPDEELAAALLGAASQASALGKLAAQLGRSIGEAQLERLLDEVREEAATDVPHEAQSGGARFVSSLAEAGAAEHLVWLGTQASGSQSMVWTPGDVERLSGVGVELDPGPARRALRSAEARGLARAHRLLVVDIEAMEGPRHPLWLRIHGDLVVHGGRGGRLPLLEDLLAGGTANVAVRRVSRSAAPALRIAWKKEGSVPLPAHTSATALEDQLACPLKWTLRHALGIRPSSIASIPEDHRLGGEFAHDLLERVFRPGPPPGPGKAEARMAELFDALLPRNAATLAIPRKLAQRNRLRRDLQAAARHFAEALQAGGYEVVGMEVPTEGEVAGVPLAGSIDCVLRGGDGEAIVDFKLGGAKKHEEKLVSGRALQLAAYAHSRQEPVRAAAYFVLTKNRILTPAAGALRGAGRAVAGPGVAETWRRFEAALASASAWLASGPVVARPLQDPGEWAPGSEVALDEEAPEKACAYCDYDGLCGRRALA